VVRSVNDVVVRAAAWSSLPPLLELILLLYHLSLLLLDRTIIFWKMLLSVPFSAGYALYEAGGFRQLYESVLVGRYYYAAAIPVQATIDVGFTLSFVYTTAANALLLIGLNPLWSAVAGKFVLGDPLPLRTYVALILALGCILIILVPDVVERNRGGGGGAGGGDDDPDVVSNNSSTAANATQAQEEGSETHGPSPTGNVIALFTGFLLAAYITIARKGQLSSKSVNLVGAAALGAAASSLVALSVRRAQVLPELFWTEQPLYQFWLAVLGQGAGIGIVFVAMTTAPKYITAAEIGIFCLLEVVLGPLFVYFAYGDVPTRWTLIGGSLLLAVLAVHEALPLLERANDTVRASFGSKRQMSDSASSSGPTSSAAAAAASPEDARPGVGSTEEEEEEEEGEKDDADDADDVEEHADAAEGGGVTQRQGPEV
jgi:drug/metabolite transporter (DMT)-like permease